MKRRCVYCALTYPIFLLKTKIVKSRVTFYRYGGRKWPIINKQQSRITVFQKRKNFASTEHVSEEKKRIRVIFTSPPWAGFAVEKNAGDKRTNSK